MKNLIGKGGGKSEYLATKILEKTGRRLEEADAPEFSPFQFGFQYSHFLYTMQPRPPFRMLATSQEFCIASVQDPNDCESVQFISGVEYEPSTSSVLLSYGINDCEARVAKLPIAKLWEMMQPIKAESEVIITGGKARKWGQEVCE